MSLHTFEIIGNSTTSKTTALKTVRAKFIVSQTTGKPTFTATMRAQDASETQAFVLELCKSGVIRDLHTERKTETPRTFWSIKARREAALSDAIRPLMKLNYRQAEGSWAGGNNSYQITIGTPAATADSYRQWSSNGKWSGLSATFKVAVMADWFRQVQAKGIALVGGLFTTHAREIAPGIFEASWVKQGRGFAISTESGVIVKAGSEFYHGTTVEQALRTAKRHAIELAVQAQADAVKSLTVADMLNQWGSVVAVRSDSTRAGNCAEGTDNWIARHMPGRTKATIKEILTADPSNSRVLLVARTAILRTLKKQEAAAA